ncbi:17.1 kDa class II heat shock protein-like [Apium graveolens]|uniref:17.1 kDa class II heat shock protein-like n=1 Tax=Apium graveolens TaxID=4045 RepID=UPI003D7BD950
MDFRLMGIGIDHPLVNAFHHILDDDNKNKSEEARSYVRDAKAMATTAADVKEYPKSYVFVVDMPGLKSGEIKVEVEEDNVLVISGERKKEEDKEGVKYVRMERKIGKFMRKFVLPDNADLENINAVCQDGVLSVTVHKLPPPEPRKPKTIEVKIA